MDKDHLLRRGYFPKELPPTFHTREFADYVARHPDMELTPPEGEKVLVSRPAGHSLARPGRLRRQLQVPNPLNQVELVDLLSQGSEEIQAHLEKSTITKSTPVVDQQELRALVTEKTGNDLPLIRSQTRAVGRHLVCTDIARFYHAIYTHSVPWALHGKAWAKKNRTGGLGNDVDKALRNSQDGQTLGVPVGPDTSLVIAELVAVAVDADLSLDDTPGFRFIDDYEFAFSTRSGAEKGLVSLEEALVKYELAINPRKTSIDRLPLPLAREWVTGIRHFDLPEGENIGVDELIAYFGHAFELARRFPDGRVIAYAVGRLRSVETDEEGWDACQDLLFQCAVAEPASLPTIVGQLHRHHEYGVAERLDAVLEGIISAHSPLRHTSEVTWALWAAIWFDRRLSAEAEEAAVLVDDPFVGLMALLAYDKGVFAGGPEENVWAPRVDISELYGRNWPLAYEARRRGWLSSVARRADVPKQSAFGQMLGAGVSFFDPDPETPVGFLTDVSGYGDVIDEGQERDLGDTLH